MSLFSDILNDNELKSYIKENTQDPWKGTALEGYVHLDAKQKGAYGEMFTKKLLEKMGREVRDRTSPGHDLTVDDLKTEVKFSVAGKKSKSRGIVSNVPVKDKFTMNHVSVGKDWDRLLFVGINPDFEESRVFWMHKSDAIDMVDKKEFFRHQQGGKKLQNDDYIAVDSHLRKMMNDPRVNSLENWKVNRTGVPDSPRKRWEP